MTGETGPLWVRADRQSAGRGRRDRRWTSESGNLYATLLLPDRSPPGQAALVGFAAAVAIVDTLLAYDPVRPVTLKWPNDAMIGGAKVSGLLVEREPDALLIGIGINLVSHPEGLPYPATHLVAEMSPKALEAPEPLFTGASALLALLSRHVEARIDTLRAVGFGAIREAWLECAHHLGRTITVNGLTGTFTDLGLDGALCMTLPDGTKERVHAGDVSFG